MNGTATLELLKVLLRMTAERNGVAAKVIATVDDLEQIAASDDADVPALKGWRREMFGEKAIALKHGRLALAVEKHRVVAVETINHRCGIERCSIAVWHRIGSSGHFPERIAPWRQTAPGTSRWKRRWASGAQHAHALDRRRHADRQAGGGRQYHRHRRRHGERQRRVVEGLDHQSDAADPDIQRHGRRQHI